MDVEALNKENIYISYVFIFVFVYNYRAIIVSVVKYRKLYGQKNP